MRVPKGSESMIYLDYAASSPMEPEAIEELQRCSSEQFANPSSLHRAAGSARSVLHHSRSVLASLLDVPDHSICFCSGGTEANNWALFCGSGSSADHIIVGASEHPSVLKCASVLQKRGVHVTFLKPDSSGMIRPSDLENAIQQNTRLISIQSANNETGVVQDLDALTGIADDHGILFHCDAVQSFGHITLPLKKAGLISLSAHKLGGPRGIGCLVIRPDALIPPLLFGGHQEFGLRPGTENIAAISSFSVAALAACSRIPEESARILNLRKQLEHGIRKAVPGTVFHLAERMLPGILNCSFPSLSGEEIQMRLDLKGICVSTGSACASEETSPSHVLLAMGCDTDEASRAVRFSLGKNTTAQEIHETVEVLSKLYENRGMKS